MMVEMGRANARGLAGLASLAAVFVAMLVPAGCGKKPDSSAAPLLCYVGGTMRPAMEKLAADYEKQTGQRIQLDYADSGELLIRIETDRRGDLYVCHDPFLDRLMQRGLGARGWTVALVTPVIVVAKGNPRKIASLKDLARQGVRVGLTDAEYSTLGHIVPVMLDKAGVRQKVEANVIKRTRGGGQIANAAALGEVDAAIVWDAVAHLRQDKLDVVRIEPAHLPIPHVDAVTSATGRIYDIGQVKVTIATLKCSRQPDAAAKFAEFVASPAGREAFRQFGFTPAPQEAAKAALRVFCGAALRHAMAELAEAFEAKTGAVVQADYAGSGVLISRIKLDRVGDLYLPGDVWYLQQVQDQGLLDGPPRTIGWFVPVIVVQKGNPKGIRTLEDLTRPGVKLALGNPKACTVGRTTEQIIARNKLDAKAMQANTVFSGMTGEELGVQVKARSADAAITWDAVAANLGGDVDVVPIPAERNIVADVAIGVLACSRDKVLAGRFADFAAGSEGKAIFAKHRYTVEKPK